MPGARDGRPTGVEPLDQLVAHSLEGPMVTAGDDERWQAVRGKAVQRHAGLPGGPSLPQQRDALDPGVEHLFRDLAGRRTHGLEEPLQELSIARPCLREEILQLGDERRDRGVFNADREGRRFDERQYPRRLTTTSR